MIEAYQKAHPETNSETEAVLETVDLDFLKQDFPKLLASMKMGANRIQQIVRSLQNFSRHDQADRKYANLHEGIDNTLLILQHRLKPVGNQPTIQIVKQYGDLPPVECYPGALNQVFMNLLNNAIEALREKYHDESTQTALPSIHIQTQWLKPDHIRLQVVDNGIGIPAAVQPRLFDPFFTTKPVGKGTGLGLAISYQIVTEKHGGTLQCCSTPGQGTTFMIELPVHPRSLA